MSSREIGKIVSIDIRGVIADVSSDLGSYVNTNDGVYFVGEVGAYVSIYEIGRIIIAEIIGVSEKTLLTDDDSMIKPNSKRQVYLNLLGEIVENKFYFGVSKMPLIFSPINIISQKELNTMFAIEKYEEPIKEEPSATKALMLNIGKSIIFPDYDVMINIDKFFGFHFAVFGNTGAGKSNTIARIIQNIFIKNNYSAKGAKFVIIDSNGEYAKAFSELNIVNPQIKCNVLTSEEGINKLEIPIWALTADDWAILLHASEKTQIPVLKRAIDIAKIFYNSKNTDDKLKNHILASTLIGILNSSDSSPSKTDKIKTIITIFNTNDIKLDSQINGKSLREAIATVYGNITDVEGIIKYLNSFIVNDDISTYTVKTNVAYSFNEFTSALEFATLYEGSVSSHRIEEYTSTLVTRLKSIQDGIQGKILCKTQHNTLDEYIEKLLGENQVLDIDISSLDDASAEVVTKVFAKLLLDYIKKYRSKAEMPINFIIEEAHRFVKNEINYGAVGYNIFERIAKEGRKFGMLLGISSQRPNELSKTVVSQCSNFIIHRVQNPDDLQYISKMVPYVNQSIIERLTYLQTGDALVFGSAINLPVLTKFDQANPQTDSDNANITEKWYIK